MEHEHSGGNPILSRDTDCLVCEATCFSVQTFWPPWITLRGQGRVEIVCGLDGEVNEFVSRGFSSGVPAKPYYDEIVGCNDVEAATIDRSETTLVIEVPTVRPGFLMFTPGDILGSWALPVLPSECTGELQKLFCAMLKEEAEDVSWAKVLGDEPSAWKELNPTQQRIIKSVWQNMFQDFVRDVHYLLSSHEMSGSDLPKWSTIGQVHLPPLEGSRINLAPTLLLRCCPDAGHDEARPPDLSNYQEVLEHMQEFLLENDLPNFYSSLRKLFQRTSCDEFYDAVGCKPHGMCDTETPRHSLVLRSNPLSELQIRPLSYCDLQDKAWEFEGGGPVDMLNWAGRVHTMIRALTVTVLMEQTGRLLTMLCSGIWVLVDCLVQLLRMYRGLFA